MGSVLDSLPLIDSKKGHDLDEPVLFQPEVGKYKPQIVALCRRLVGSASGGTHAFGLTSRHCRDCARQSANQSG